VGLSLSATQRNAAQRASPFPPLKRRVAETNLPDVLLIIFRKALSNQKKRKKAKKIRSETVCLLFARCLVMGHILL